MAINGQAAKTTNPEQEPMLRRLFLDGRSYQGFTSQPVTDADLAAIYRLARWAPTSANTNPARFVFVCSADAKARLAKHLAPLNVEKAASAPANVIVARDTQFHELMPQLFPGRDARTPFVANPAMAEETARRNTTLQGAYFILAARALGFDCGPMSGFNAETLNAEFFPDGRLQADFLINVGHGDPEKLWPRNPRLDVEDACQTF